MAIIRKKKTVEPNTQIGVELTATLVILLYWQTLLFHLEMRLMLIHSIQQARSSAAAASGTGFCLGTWWAPFRHVPDGWQKRGDKLWPWQLCSLLNSSVAIAFPCWCHPPLLKTGSSLQISQVYQEQKWHGLASRQSNSRRKRVFSRMGQWVAHWS